MTSTSYIKNTAVNDRPERPLILIAGPSGSGKDTIADKICERYGLKKLISYATRSPRFEGEGTHVFTDKDHFPNPEDVVAWTSIYDEWYGATKEQVDSADVYVINGQGAILLKDRYKTSRPVFFVFLTVDDSCREERMAERGSSESEFKKRRLHDTMYLSEAKMAARLYRHSLFVENNEIEQTVNIIAKYTGLESGQTEIMF